MLGLFLLLAVMTHVAMSICVQVFLVWTYVFTSLGSIPRSGMPGSYGNNMYNHGKIATVSKVTAPFYIPPGGG